MLENFVFMPAKVNDLNDIYDLILTSRSGLTSLPKNKMAIKKYIDDSVDSFRSSTNLNSKKRFLFVLKEKVQHKVVGISAITNSINNGNNFKSFKFNKIYVNDQLDINNSYISLEDVSSKWSELCSLYLHPDYRYSGVGRFLSMARFLFIFQHKHLFKNELIAELRGLSSDNQGSLFWNYVMQPIYKMSFNEALLSISEGKKIDFDLFPKENIYLKSLPQELVSQLGKCHVFTKGAYSILKSESFAESEYIDVLDAGPKLTGSLAKLDELQRVKLLEDFSVKQELVNKKYMLVSSGSDYNFSVYSVIASEQKNRNELLLNYDNQLKFILSRGQIKYYMNLFPLLSIKKLNSKFIHNIRTVSKYSLFSNTFSNWYLNAKKEYKKSFYQ